MKVKTDLHSGGFFEDAGTQVDAVIRSASNIVSKADRQAKVLTSNVVGTTSDIWNSIRTTFSF